MNTLKLCPLKLEAVINRNFRDHQKDNATATSVIGQFGDTQIQVISTNEKAFLVETDNNNDLALIESKPSLEALLEELIGSIYDIVDQNESLALDDKQDREVLKLSLVEAITKKLTMVPK